MKSRFFLGVLLVVLGAIFFSSVDSKSAKKINESDKYKVIHVDGKILFQKTSTEMKKGDVFLSGTALSFKTLQSRAAVISSIKGRFVLSASEKGQTKILPAANNISSRSGALINTIDLKNHFAGKYLIIGTMSLELSQENFPMTSDNFFYLSFEYNGELIRKKLPNSENLLIFDKDEIFKIDGEPIAVEPLRMGLFYRKGEKSLKINDFIPVFAELIEIKDEVQIILDEFSDRDNSTKIQEITAYLDEFYGKPQKDNLAAWLKVEFNLE